MSAFQKLFLATAILATGLAVAILLGQPVVGVKVPAPPRPQPLQPVALAPPATSSVATTTVPSVRLLPDVDAPSKTTNTLDAPALLAPLAASSSFSYTPTDSTATQFAAIKNVASPRSFDNAGPAVHLRNEAPRAIGNEPRSSLTIRRLPPIDGQPSFAPNNVEPSQFASGWSATTQPPGALANLASSPPAMAATPAMPTAFSNPYAVEENRPASAPPAFASDDVDDSHTHVVADGDSLEKLAALYLSDPQRGKEIYELNRDILSDPNLLPIGVELKIPDRVSHTSWNSQSRRPGYQGDPTIRQAANGDLVPVRALYETNVIPPHAQLTRPIAAD